MDIYTLYRQIYHWIYFPIQKWSIFSSPIPIEFYIFLKLNFFYVERMGPQMKIKEIRGQGWKRQIQNFALLLHCRNQFGWNVITFFFGTLKKCHFNENFLFLSVEPRSSQFCSHNMTEFKKNLWSSLFPCVKTLPVYTFQPICHHIPTRIAYQWLFPAGLE